MKKEKDSKHWDGWAVVPNKIICDKNLTQNDKVIYLAINSFGFYKDEYGNTKPKKASANYLSKVTGMCAKTASESLKRLVEFKYITLCKKYTNESPNEFMVNWELRTTINAVGVESNSTGGMELNSTGGMELNSTNREYIKKKIHKKERDREESPHHETTVSFSSKRDATQDYDDLRKSWNSNENLKAEQKNDLNGGAKKLVDLLIKYERREIYLLDLQNAAINYAKAKALPNTWLTSKVGFKSFYGLNGSKPFFERFLPGNFDIDEYDRGGQKDCKKIDTKERVKELMDAIKKKY